MRHIFSAPLRASFPRVLALGAVAVVATVAVRTAVVPAIADPASPSTFKMRVGATKAVTPSTAFTPTRHANVAVRHVPSATSSQAKPGLKYVPPGASGLVKTAPRPITAAKIEQGTSAAGGEKVSIPRQLQPLVRARQSQGGQMAITCTKDHDHSVHAANTKSAQ